MLIAPTGGSNSKPLSLLPHSRKPGGRAVPDINTAITRTINQPTHPSSISHPMSPQSPFIRDRQIDQDKLRRYKTQLVR